MSVILKRHSTSLTGCHTSLIPPPSLSPPPSSNRYVICERSNDPLQKVIDIIFYCQSRTAGSDFNPIITELDLMLRATLSDCSDSIQYSCLLFGFEIKISEANKTQIKETLTNTIKVSSALQIFARRQSSS